MGVPRLVVAGTHSGVGKTTVAVGIMAALRRRGLVVQPFKVGPDYIDPTHHLLATDRASRNLDSWMVPKPALLELFQRACRGADVAVIEGVMGLFDGHGGADESGSTAEIAKLIGSPVLVIIDARSMARSAAAIAWGYSRFDPDLQVAGFLLNRIAGEKHFQMAREAIEDAGVGQVFGYLPRDPVLSLPERHLGLVPTPEEAPPEEYLGRLVELIESHVDVGGLLEAISHQSPANSEQADEGRESGVGNRSSDSEPRTRNPALSTQHSALTRSSVPSPRPCLFPGRAVPRRAVIAVARDEAFNFYYQDNLDLLEAHGAELLYFSPVRDAGVPEGAGALYLGGGFPEMHAARLAANESMLESVRRAVAAGMPVYGECGGLMFLSEGIVGPAGERFPMVGAVPGWCSMAEKRLNLGYVEVRSRAPGPLGPAGYFARGHEFHYSRWEGLDPSAAAYEVINQSGRAEGFARGSLLASFAHIHFAANPALAPAFVESAAGYAPPSR